MTKILSTINGFVWGAPALILILGVGLYLSLRLGFIQLRWLPRAFGALFQDLLHGKDSSFRSLCTALGATVGTGNLVGVAGAVCIGGPGAVFWIWVCGFLGMVTKYAEATLAVRYRVPSEQGFQGGPMYIITRGMGERFRPLAGIYCLFGTIAAFGVGNATQINAAISGIRSIIEALGGTPSKGLDFSLGLLLAALVGIILLGGAVRIGAAAEKLVPAAAIGYVLMSIGVLCARTDRIFPAFGAIIRGAFDPRAVTGGILGSAFQSLRIGCSRGVFTNEAGMGTASIAHASARVAHPAQQGLMGILEVFLDTIVICTLTALVILVSGVPIPYGTDAGATLATDAFSVVYGPAAVILTGSMLICFAVATVLGWGLYGARCAEFLFGPGMWKIFTMAQIAVMVLSAVLDGALLWQLAETINGLMMIPNLIALAACSPEIIRLTNEYKKTGRYSAAGGTYADFYQRKPL